MKKVLIWVIPAVALVALIGWRFSVKSSTESSLKGGGAAPGGGRGGAGGGASGGAGRGGGGVQVAVATRGDIATTLQAVGTVISPYKLSVSPKTAGRIEYLNVRVGDKVRKGDVLVRIDPSTAQAAVYQQQAGVAEAQSRLAQAQATQGSTEVGITSTIQQQSAGLVSAQADLNQVQRNYDAQVQSAQAGVDDAKSKLTSAQATVKSAQAGLDNARANARNAQVKYDRTYDLYKKAFIAAQDVDDARTQLDVANGQVNAAEQTLNVAQASVDSANSSLRSASANLSIVKRKGLADIAASKAKVTQARASVNVAQANRSQSPAYQQNIAALRASVNAAQAQLRQAQVNLNDTVLRSTIEGTVTARNADPGVLASPGAAILEVQYLDWLYVSTSVPLESVSQLREGLKATIKLEALPGQTFVGPITNINGAADPVSRQVTILIRLDNKAHKISPGMFGSVNIELGRVQNATLVPQEAINKTEAGATVTLVDKDSVAHVVPVELGPSQNGKVQILEGVHVGDKVVTLTYNAIKDGSKVSLGGPSGGRSGGRQGGRGAGGQGQRQGQ